MLNNQKVKGYRFKIGLLFTCTVINRQLSWLNDNSKYGFQKTVIKIGKEIKYLFKVIKSDNTVLTYILPNETNNMSYRDFKVPYSELVKKININLLPELK